MAIILLSLPFSFLQKRFAIVIIVVVVVVDAVFVVDDDFVVVIVVVVVVDDDDVFVVVIVVFVFVVFSVTSISNSTLQFLCLEGVGFTNLTFSSH